MIPLTEDEIEAFERRIAAAHGRQVHDLYWTHEEMGRALATIEVMRDALCLIAGPHDDTSERNPYQLQDIARAVIQLPARDTAPASDDPCSNGHANDIPFRDRCPKCGQ